ncbi:hypothetical protein ES702_01256 [subsurface metagenome]
MAAPFDYPNNSIQGIVSFMQYTNGLVGGLLGPGMLIMIGFVAFFSTKHYSTDRAMGFATFLTLISAIFLRFLELINDAILFLVIVIFIGSLIFLIRERGTEEAGV